MIELITCLNLVFWMVYSIAMVQANSNRWDTWTAIFYAGVIYVVAIVISLLTLGCHVWIFFNVAALNFPDKIAIAISSLSSTIILLACLFLRD